MRVLRGALTARRSARAQAQGTQRPRARPSGRDACGRAGLRAMGDAQPAAVWADGSRRCPRGLHAKGPRGHLTVRRASCRAATSTRGSDLATPAPQRPSRVSSVSPDAVGALLVGRMATLPGCFGSRSGPQGRPFSLCAWVRSRREWRRGSCHCDRAREAGPAARKNTGTQHENRPERELGQI